MRYILLVIVGLIVTDSLAGPLSDLQTTPAIRYSTRDTLPTPQALEARKRYRACLFAYLPRVGSDVAAELLRHACAEEFLSPDERQRSGTSVDRQRRGRSANP